MHVIKIANHFFLLSTAGPLSAKPDRVFYVHTTRKFSFFKKLIENSCLFAAGKLGSFMIEKMSETIRVKCKKDMLLR